MRKEIIDVLMIEDLKVAQIVAFNLFKELNCKLTIVTTATRALEQILTKHYDIIFIDIQLPDINGFELAETIRHVEKKTVHIPLIAVTANSSEDLGSKSKVFGFDDHLIKPLTIESIRNVLNRYLSRTNVA